MTNEVKLGTIPGEDCERDAVHVAVIPMVAAHDMLPGHRVGIDIQGRADSQANPHVGIVDPFLRGAVTAGTRFYLCLLPGTATGMRHHWMHPAFLQSTGENDALRESIEWLRGYAMNMNPYDAEEGIEVAYATLMDGLRNGEMFAHGTDLHCFDELNFPDELKFHAERVLGHTIDLHSMSYRCSC